MFSFVTKIKQALSRVCFFLLGAHAEVLCHLTEFPPQIPPAASNPLNPEVVYHPLLEIWARFPSCILRYLPTHTATHTKQHMEHRSYICSLFAVAQKHTCFTMTTRVQTQTCTETDASLIPIKWALCVSGNDGLLIPLLLLLSLHSYQCSKNM